MNNPCRITRFKGTWQKQTLFILTIKSILYGMYCRVKRLDYETEQHIRNLDFADATAYLKQLLHDFFNQYQTADNIDVRLNEVVRSNQLIQAGGQKVDIKELIVKEAQEIYHTNSWKDINYEIESRNRTLQTHIASLVNSLCAYELAENHEELQESILQRLIFIRNEAKGLADSSHSIYANASLKGDARKTRKELTKTLDTYFRLDNDVQEVIKSSKSTSIKKE